MNNESQSPPNEPTMFERSVKPGCMLTMVIWFLAILAVKRFTPVSPVLAGILGIMVFVGVMVLLVRVRPVSDEADLFGSTRDPLDRE